MKYPKVSLSVDCPYKLYKANGGGITFSLHPKENISENMGSENILLLNRKCPHERLYTICFNIYEDFKIKITSSKHTDTWFDIPSDIQVTNKKLDLWMSWYNNELCIGLLNKDPFLIHSKDDSNEMGEKEHIGYIQFENSFKNYWIVEDVPRIYNSVKYMGIQNGKLHWVDMDDDKLPVDAFIGGFENNPIYIARTEHFNSVHICTYEPSSEVQLSSEIQYSPDVNSESFQILCGYNAKWVKCKNYKIPENTFVAGISNERNAPIYIGKSFIDGDVIIGEVHFIHKICYLLYNSSYIEIIDYEVLVDMSVEPRADISLRKCRICTFSVLAPNLW